MRVPCTGFLLLALAGAAAAGTERQFLRGDSNGDGRVDISDPVFTLCCLFTVAGFELPCEAAADANGDEALTIADPVYSLTYLFAGGKKIPPPYPEAGCPAESADELTCASYGENVPCDGREALIIDQTCRSVDGIPPASIEAAKTAFRIWYGHTSHGSQIMTGISVMRDALFDYNNGVGTLSIAETSGDLGNPDATTWAARTREQLDRSDNDRNMVMWSWCGQVSGRTEEVLQQDYLDLMATLEEEYPGVTFVYMTGHLDGSGVAGNLNQRNEQIRAFCRAHNKVLFDFAAIESYDPDGAFFLDKGANDNCDWREPGTGTKRNWADEWCAAHPGSCASCGCAHSKCLNCQLKGRAFWHMMARLAGWNGS